MSFQERYENVGKTPRYEDTLKGRVVVGYEEVEPATQNKKTPTHDHSLGENNCTLCAVAKHTPIEGEFELRLKDNQFTKAIIDSMHTPDIEGIVDLLCRHDNHVSGDSGSSNKYAIKKSSVKKALQSQANKYEREKGEMVREMLDAGVVQGGKRDHIWYSQIETIAQKYGVDLSEQHQEPLPLLHKRPRITG